MTSPIHLRWPKPAWETFAGLAAAGLVATAWWIDAARRDQRAAQVHRTLVDLLLNALTAGEASTARHSRRVANYTDAVARALGFSRQEHATLRVASLLHDMGKIEDRFFDIVHSRHPLSPEQRAEIRKHPSESAYILQPLEPLHPEITAIVGSHHECWDGSGYPRGLQGEAIPLAARIISVADVFDAMTQTRSYREGLSFEEGMRELQAGAGERFDPGVVELVASPEVQRRWREIFWSGRAEEAREQGAHRRPEAAAV